MTDQADESGGRNWSDWLKIIGAALGVVTVIFGAISGGMAYFATQNELLRVSCISTTSDEIYRHRTRANNAYSDYLGLNMEVMGQRIKIRLKMEVDQTELSENQKKANDALVKSISEKEKAEDIAASLQQGICNT